MLWNNEYPLVINRIIDIVEAHNPHAIHLGLSFDKIAAYRPLLVKIEVQERADRDSETLRELDTQRDMLYNVIYTVTKAFKRAPITDVSQNAAQIMAFLKKHGSNIPVSNYTAETKRLYDLAADAHSQPEIMASLRILSLKPLFERMCEINKEFDLLFMQRIHRKAENVKFDIRSVRTECDKDVAAFWRAVEFCCKEYGEEIYLPMIKEINTLNSYYKQQLAARATRRKAKNGNYNEVPIKPMECNVCDAENVA